MNTHEFKVPFARVSAPHFLHLFDCEVKSMPDLKKFQIQRELACNLSDLSAKITQNDSNG
jgi:hypothetical protein